MGVNGQTQNLECMGSHLLDQADALQVLILVELEAAKVSDVDMDVSLDVRVMHAVVPPFGH